jgi:hypothetical protein
LTHTGRSQEGGNPTYGVKNMARLLLLILVALLTLLAGCEETGELSESDREVLINSADADDLLSYCEILEILYAEPESDQRVIEKMENFVFKNVYPFVLAEAKIDELGLDQMDAIEAFLRLSENSEFARTKHPEFFRMYIEYLSAIEPEFDSRREWIRENTIIIL